MFCIKKLNCYDFFFNDNIIAQLPLLKEKKRERERKNREKERKLAVVIVMETINLSVKR